VKLYAKVARIVATGEGNGPVHALDTGLWLAQLPRPVKSSDGEGEWDTIGVPENVVAASWDALVDAVSYGLLRQEGLLSRDGLRREKSDVARGADLPAGAAPV